MRLSLFIRPKDLKNLGVKDFKASSHSLLEKWRNVIKELSNPRFAAFCILGVST